MKSDTPAAKAIAAAQGNEDLLRGDVLKVSHHGSKHGVNLELVERVGPKVTLVSSVGEEGQFNFPHTVAQELIREAINPTEGLGDHPLDYLPDMNLFYTADIDTSNATLGTIGLVMSVDACSMWRFGDEPDHVVDFTKARRWEVDLW